jgi:ankyrin repeat protein
MKPNDNRNVAERCATTIYSLRFSETPSTKESMNRINRELIEAAKENNVPDVRRLLRAGADTEAKDSDGSTSLIVASRRGHVQVFKELLGHGADVESTTSYGWTPLHCACCNGHLVIVIELIGPNNSDGASTSILGKRKSQRANMEAKNNKGNTPLHLASCTAHVEIVQALLSGGANALAVNNQERLPINFAVTYGSSAVAKCLFQQLYATTRRLPLHKLLHDLTWIGNPNSRDYPPLRAALGQNVLGTDDVVEIVEFLVDRNPELLSSHYQDGSLPLHVACRRGASFSIVQSLVNRYKASVKSVTPGGDLPLFLACEMPETYLDTIFLLMKLYPDLVYR